MEFDCQFSTISALVYEMPEKKFNQFVRCPQRLLPALFALVMGFTHVSCCHDDQDGLADAGAVQV